MASSSDRRQRIRVPVQSKIRHSQYQVLGTPVFQENSSIDLSSNGISFETEREYQKGNLVLLEVQINHEPMKLLVCVAWVKPANKAGIRQIGAELIAIDPVHKRQMQKHLNSMLDVFDKTKAKGKAKPKAKIKIKTSSKTSAKKKTAGLKKSSASRTANSKTATRKKVAKKSVARKAAGKTAKKSSAKIRRA